MGVSFEWKNKDICLPIKAIYYNPKHQAISIQFDNETLAIESLEVLQGLDSRSQRRGPVITLNSKDTSPQALSAYLLDQELIDQECFLEMQSDMGHKRKKDKGGDGRA